MSKILKRNSVFFAVVALICAMCVCLVCFAVSENSASADSSFVKTDSVSIGHITDTHYYALRLCYTDGTAIDTDDPDYFYNWVMSKSTKLWLESAAAFDASMARLAKEMPDYVVLSGDCAQDGELMGHIDVANKLRKLQNTVREIKPDFQVFVVMGNHDLYNPETYRFDKTGMREKFYYTTRYEVAQIYAGLGYPNMTEEEANAFYGPLMAMDGGVLMPEGYQYVRSNLSSAFDYAWEFVKKDGNKTQVFSFDGATDPAHDEVTVAKLYEAGNLITIDNSAMFRENGLCYSYSKLNKSVDFDMGYLTGIHARKDNAVAFITADIIISNAIDGHVLGGQLQEHTREWLVENQNMARPTEETTIIGIMHHSVNPHWSMEEEITTGFILYNPIETADFFADYGMRYAYTGHQHANDKASYVSTNGNQIIDMEGAANVSVGSQVKITTIERGTYEGSYAENAYLASYPNLEIDATELYNKVLKDDKYGYVAKNRVGEFINGTKKTITNYSLYARRRVYDNIVDNYINIYLRKDITSKLKDILGGMFDNSSNALIKSLSGYVDDIVLLADNLIQEINVKVLKDYTYGGDNDRFKAEDMKVFGFLEEMVRRVLTIDLSGEGDEMLDVFMDCYMRHCTGEDWNSYQEMIAEKPSYAKAFANVKNGKFVDELLNVLLDDKKGLMFLINGLCNTTFDLTDGLSTGFTSLINAICTSFGVVDANGNNISLATFNLGALAKSLGNISLISDLLNGFGMQIDLANMSIPEIIDDIVVKYCTDNFKQGLGEYAHNIMMGFGIDGGHNDVVDGNKQLLKVSQYKDEAVTYVARQRKEVVSIENGKLPSMLTNNFGTDVTTTRNFTYFTDRRVTDGAIQYTSDVVNHTGIITKNAVTQLIGTTKPLIDLGIWCQSGYIELSRHTVELIGLKADTTYAYRAGSPTKGYWSEWYTFTTASADGTFEAFVYTDVQSSTKSAYERIATIQKDIINTQFTNGVSFTINPGDLVDNGRNLSQYRWLYDTDQAFGATYASIVAAGNHDNKYFSVEKASNVEYYGGVSENAYVDEYNYLYTHYNYALSSSQVGLGGFYYSFDYGKVHFIVLNTNDIEDVKVDKTTTVKQLGKNQYNWLVSDLQNSDAEYKVVVMHKSLYSEGSHSYDQDVVGMRAQLTPLFAEQGVNLVLAGHDHVYNETYYIDGNGKKVKTDANGKNQIGKNGTLYVTMGCMGEKFYNFVDNPNIDTATGTDLHVNGQLQEPTYGKLVFDGENLYYYGYQYLRKFDADGNVIGGKSVAIEKAGDYMLQIIILCALGAIVLLLVLGIVVSAIKGSKAKKAQKAQQTKMQQKK